MPDAVDRTEKLLALLILHAMKGQPQREKAHVLNLAGLSNVEIADLLDTTTQTVAQHLYEHRKRKPSSRRRKSKATAGKK